MELIIVVLLSAIILYAYERKSLLALGLTPVGKRLFQFFQGVFAAIVVYLFMQGIYTVIHSHQWAHNITTSSETYLNHLIETSKTALLEELIFRGVLLYILIKVINARVGIVLSAVAFGIYSMKVPPTFDFTYLYNFSIITLFGTVLAFAFVKTKSLLLPLGLNLTWAFLAPMFGRFLFVSLSSVEPNIYLTYLSITLTVFLPNLLFYLFIKYTVEKDKPIIYIPV